MKKYLISFFISIFFFFEFSFILQSGIILAQCTEGSVTYAEGARICGDRVGPQTRIVKECKNGILSDVGTCYKAGGFNICKPATPPAPGEVCNVPDSTFQLLPSPTPSPTQCSLNTHPITGDPLNPPFILANGNQGCLGEIAAKCTGGNLDTIENCENTGRICVHNIDVGGVSSAYCDFAPTPTLIPPTPTTTLTPTPDSSAFCEIPERPGIKFKDRAQICIPQTRGYDVQQCIESNNTWKFVHIGECQTGKLSLCNPKNPPEDGDECPSSMYVADMCVNETIEFGQEAPKPANNCGMPVDSRAQPISGVKNDPNNPVYSCCFPKTTVTNTCVDKNDLSGLDGLPGFLDDKIKQGIDSSKSRIIPGFGSANDLQEQLNKIKPCIFGNPSILKEDGTYVETPDAGVPNCICALNTRNGSELCKNVTDDGTENDERSECERCLGYDANTNTHKMNKMYTALGCVDTSPQGVIKSSMNLGIGIGGAFSLMCIIYAAFMYQTSMGNPEKIKKGRDLMTSCISGLLLIIFSVFILRLIGYDILRLPGFGRP